MKLYLPTMAKQKKEGAEEPIEKQLWKTADKLRKNIDAAEYKHIVLGLVFLKYISDAFVELYDKLKAEESAGADPEDKDEYKAENIRRIVALRGDLPSGTGYAGEFRYANELVDFIRAETGDLFSIEVAAYPEWHPQARSPEDDLSNFVRKVKAGANSAITQYFYNADAYFHFVDTARARGVDIPIVPGIMPIAGFSKLARFSDACGAEIPRWMRKKFEGFGDDAESIKAFGLDVVTELCEKLLAGGAPGLHFYCMNQAALTTEICKRLKLA